MQDNLSSACETAAAVVTGACGYAFSGSRSLKVSLSLKPLTLKPQPKVAKFLDLAAP